MSAPDNPPAFPLGVPHMTEYQPEWGMSMRDYFAGQAMSNPAICDGNASQWELDAWFGKTRTGIKRREIVAKQAVEYADAMLAERAK